MIAPDAKVLDACEVLIMQGGKRIPVLTDPVVGPDVVMQGTDFVE